MISLSCIGLFNKGLSQTIFLPKTFAFGSRAGPQREKFPGGTKINIGPPNLIGPPSLIGALAIKSFFSDGYRPSRIIILNV